MSRDVRAVIDLAALRHNFSVVKKFAPTSRAMAVVKANGYGHGMREAAKALVSADAFAVSCLDEALTLREEGLLHPIVMLEGFFNSSELRIIAAHRLDIVVHTEWQLEALEQDRLQRPVRVWVKVDTGMHRIGFQPEQVSAVLQRLQACASVREVRLMTHLACADDRSSDFTLQQLAQFEQVCAGQPLERSIANSAGILAWPGSHAEWVRPGIMLYGASPFADGGERPDLRPVMTLSSRLIAVQHYRRGETVGYAGSYVCPEDMPVGVVAIGYGDGYPRHASNGGPVLVKEHRTNILGRVSMDMLCVDLRGIDDAQVDDPVTLWGKGLPVEEVAEACGTIAYELLCQLTQRVRFEYQDQYVES